MAKNQENEDFLRFQYQELKQAQLSDGEQDTLEQEVSTLEHAEDIKTALYQAENMLSNESNGTVETITEVNQTLQNIKDIYPPIQEISKRMESCYIEIKDILQDISTQTEAIEYDPQQLEEKQLRLDLINTLEHKFHVESIAELLQKQNELQKQLSNIDNSDEELKQQEAIVAQLLNECTQKAKALSQIRKKTSKIIEGEMIKRLAIQEWKFRVDNICKEVDKEEFSDRDIGRARGEK